MSGILVFKRCLSDAQRKDILLDCLNNKFDKVLSTIRKIAPADMDYSILQTILSRGCYHGHIESVSHIWYKYVRREKSLIVSPPLLCEIGTLALNEGKYYLPKQLHYHFKLFFGPESNSSLGQYTEYELLRIKVESFAKGTSSSTNFREKWKVFLEDVDHHFPPDFRLSVWDYPHLARSIPQGDDDRIVKMLFTEDQIEIVNNHTLPLLLNMILLQKQHSIERKFNLFRRFHQFCPTLKYDDTLTILLRQCELACDGYRMNVLLEYVQDNKMPQLCRKASEIMLRARKQTNHATIPV